MNFKTHQPTDKFYVRVNNETMSATLQRYYGSYHKSVSDALDAIPTNSHAGDLAEVIDEFGKVYGSVNRSTDTD